MIKFNVFTLWNGWGSPNYEIFLQGSVESPTLDNTGIVIWKDWVLNLTTLETRFPKADLIEVYKIFKGLDKLDLGRFFDVVDGATRGQFEIVQKKGEAGCGEV